MIAWDVALHYRMTYQGTGMKGQLVAPDKKTALLYKRFFDEFGEVSTELLMSPPNIVEGENRTKTEVSEAEKEFWNGMMDRYGTESKYNKLLVNAFKKGDEPEIIIVVDKLLTGFDAPCNTVLYLARKLKGHTLLQAIARVNRLYDGKEYGLILDYSGVIEELDQAIDFYHELADFDPDDVAETVHMIEDQAAKLPQYHSDLWELFPAMRGSVDTEVFAEHLRPKDLRDKFYDRFGLFAGTLSLALSSTTFLEDTPEDQIQQYKRDLKFFANLRADVSYRFQERIDFSEYEPKIQKLIDQHVTAGEIVTLCEAVDLFDAAERQKVLEAEGKSTEVDAKADTIASAAKRIIDVEMQKDPAFYRKFSKMLQDVLDDLYEKRIEALDALDKINDIYDQVSNHSDSGVPDALQGHDMARRYHGIVRTDDNPLSPDAIRIALEIEKRLPRHKIRDWRRNADARKKMEGEIDDIFFEIAGDLEIEVPLELQDKMIQQCIEITIANED